MRREHVRSRVPNSSPARSLHIFPMLPQSTLNPIYVDLNNKLINKIDHELRDVQDNSWESLRWYVSSPAVLWKVWKNQLWCSLSEHPFLIGDLIKYVLPFGSPSKQSLCKINFAFILQHRAREETPRWHFPICCNEPCLPVAPLSATIMACNLLVMCEGKTFIPWHLGIFYFLFPMCSTSRPNLL